MFKIAVQSGGPEELYGIDAAYRMIGEAGFDGIDANLDLLGEKAYATKSLEGTPFGESTDQAFVEHFKPYKEAAEKYGLDNYQAHAPFPSFVQDPSGEFNANLMEMLKKTIRACDYINCRNLIIHPFFLPYGKMDPQTEWNVNIERYSELIPAAKEYGVTICLENMFTNYRGKIYEACCSDITKACSYIDTLNGLAGQECFGFCLDTGHLLLLGKDIKDAMVQLGSRIKAFHVHDNNALNDQHLAPYMGILDWKRFVEGLAAIGFDKTMSFETFNIWNAMDPEICPDMMKLIAKTGRMFARRAEEIRKGK